MLTLKVKLMLRMQIADTSGAGAFEVCLIETLTKTEVFRVDAATALTVPAISQQCTRVSKLRQLSVVLLLGC